MSLTFDHGLTVQAIDNSVTFSHGLKIVGAVEFSHGITVIDSTGSFLGTMTDSEWTATSYKQGGDTAIILDASAGKAKHRYYTGSATIDAGREQEASESGETNLIIAPTTGGWRVEIGDATYPVRFWNGTVTNFYLDTDGDVNIAGDLDVGGTVTLTGSGAFRTAASGQRVEMTASDFDRILLYDDSHTTAGLVRTLGGHATGALVIASPYTSTDVTASMTLTSGVSGATQLSIAAASVTLYDGTLTTKLKGVLEATATWDPGNMAADGNVVSTTITVTGAAVGDVVYASHSAIGANDVLVSAHVQATNTVRVVLMNKTGGALDIASGTLRVLVTK